MKKLLVIALALVAFATAASADVPDQTKCTVVPADALNGMIVCPRIPSALTASILTITVKNSSNNPINNASVIVILTAANPTCPNAVLTATSNASGVATITVAASGCANGVPASGIVKANGVTIRSYSNVKSPDFDGAAGDGFTNLSDLVKFANEFNNIDPAACHDYTNDGACNLSDLIPFSEAFAGAKKCQ